jgi:hypothetical protein
MLHARLASCWCTGWHTNTIITDVDCSSIAVIYQCSLFYCLIVVCTRQVTNQGELVGGLQGLLLLLLLLPLQLASESSMHWQSMCGPRSIIALALGLCLVGTALWDVELQNPIVPLKIQPGCGLHGVDGVAVVMNMAFMAWVHDA